jgi:hypothetical protein
MRLLPENLLETLAALSTILSCLFTAARTVWKANRPKAQSRKGPRSRGP